MAENTDAVFELVDTHCHIQSAGGAADGEAGTRNIWAKAGPQNPYDIFARAKARGVTRIVCVGCDVDDSALAVSFVKHETNAFASIGIHPHEADRYTGNKDELKRFRGLASLPGVVAVGECGLDYYYEHSSKTAQQAILRFQIELAQEHDLPLIFHVRDALDDFWPIFDAYYTAAKPVRGVLHSFTDTQPNLDKAIERGLYIGVNGIATFAKNDAQLAMYKAIPLSRLLLETDAPFLTPSPYRGTICEPYHISVIAEFLGQLRNEAPEGLAKATTNNAKNLFKFV